MTTQFHRSVCLCSAALASCLISIGASHAGDGKSRVNVIRVPGDAKVVKAKLGADGTIHVLLDAEDGPRDGKPTDRGFIFSAPMTIGDTPSQRPGLNFRGGALGFGKDGRVHV